MSRSERGSAVVESIFGIAMLLFLAVGTIQVALTLYARNVVQAAVHDGSRAVVEVGGAHGDAETVARSVIEQSAGSLLDDLDIETSVDSGSDRVIVHVRATGRLVAPGPIPIELPITVGSTSSREVLDVDD
jgi:Flp pilus assembly protein TadG